MLLIAASLAATAGGVAACGEEGISVQPDAGAAPLPRSSIERCSGCHTLSVAGTQGSTTNVRTREYKDGPNFDQRKVTRELRAVRDPQRRLLLRPDAAEHRRRRGGRGAGAVPRREVGLGRRAAPGATTPPDCPPARVGRMLDLRAIARDPEPVRAALARRRDGSDERLDAALAAARAAERAAARARGGAGRAQRRREGDRRGQAHRRRRLARRSPRCRPSARGSRSSSPRSRGSRRELDELQRVAAEPARPDRRRRGQRRCASGATLRAGRPRPPRAGGRDDRHGGRLEGLRLALRLPEGRPRASSSWRSCAGCWRCCAGTASSRSSRRCWSRRRRCSAPASCPTPSSRSTALADDPLYLTGTSEVPLASLHAGEIMDEVPRRYAGFSPCFRREAGAAGQGHARHLPRAPVRQGRDVRVRRAGRRRRPSTSGCWRSRRRSSRRSEIPYRVVNIAVDDLGSSAPPRSTTSRPGCRRSSATASSPRPRTRPTSSRAGSTSATGRTAASPSTSTR